MRCEVDRECDQDQSSMWVLTAIIAIDFPTLVQIVFHTKCMPWFVSDASIKDVQWVISQLQTSRTNTSL